MTITVEGAALGCSAMSTSSASLLVLAGLALIGIRRRK
jgi:MYXO-CTERM domain-containing protein